MKEVFSFLSRDYLSFKRNFDCCVLTSFTVLFSTVTPTRVSLYNLEMFRTQPSSPSLLGCSSNINHNRRSVDLSTLIYLLERLSNNVLRRLWILVGAK